jgi:hypothetical protein
MILGNFNFQKSNQKMQSLRLADACLLVKPCQLSQVLSKPLAIQPISLEPSIMVLPKNAITWFAYLDDEDLFELPFNFNFNTATTDEVSKKNLIASITPRILQAGFFGEKAHPTSYEFYYPSIAGNHSI